MSWLKDVACGVLGLVAAISGYFLYVYAAFHLCAFLGIGLSQGDGFEVGQQIIGHGASLIVMILPAVILLAAWIGRQARGDD